MDADTSGVVAVRMPQANVNDEEVTLVGWHVPDGGQAIEGRPLCEVETSKAVGDVDSPASGVLKQMAQVGDVVGVGEVFGYIGRSAEVVEAYVSARPDSRATGAGRVGDTGVTATAGAIELAARYGVDLVDVPASGDRVRRSDVESFVAQRGLKERVPQEATPTGPIQVLPPALADRVSDEGALPDWQRSMAGHLARTQAGLVTAHVAMDAGMGAAVAWIETQREAGVMAGPVPVLLHAAAAAIAKEPRLASFRLGRRVYRYRAVDVAYTARSRDGRLFTPVVREVDKRTLEQLASECGRLNMAVFRGQIAPADLTGGCLTVSILSEQPVRSHVGLQNACQSAILTAGAIRDEVAMIGGRPVAIPTVTLTLSYDHGLMDGWEAASALQAAKAAIESIR